MIDENIITSIDNVLAKYSDLSGLQAEFIPIDESYSSKCNLCKLCSRIVESDTGKAFCCEERHRNSRIALSKQNVRIFTCSTGLTEWICPVIFNDEILGYVYSGCVVISPNTIDDIIEQDTYYKSEFNIDTDELKFLTAQITHISRKTVDDYANLLMLLIQSQLPIEDSAQGIGLMNDFSNTDELTNNLTENDVLEEIPSEHPLSFYISKNNLNSPEFRVFWNTVEAKAVEVFTSNISGKFLAGHLALDELMQLAYSEETLINVKTSASMLYHITTLKFASEAFYDLRFYSLTFNTLKKLHVCTSVQQVKDVILNSFQVIYNFYNTESDMDEKAISKNIIRYLEQNYSKDIKIEDIGSHMCMSSAYASRIFKAETKLTIKQYLTNIRMKHAQDLVLNSDTKIKDIGYLVGYTNDIRGFYKMFRKHFGMTCRDMRKNHYKES